jgi:segregation and condensation protein A
MNIVESAESGVYWKRIIYEIVTGEEFDPWDIDVGSLTDAYMNKIKEIKMVNFEIPGTVILVGSVLLKLKSDIVSGQTFIFEGALSMDEGDAEEEEPVAEIDEITGEPLPPSSLASNLYVRRIPKRKVTLPELMIFLKRVITQVENKDSRQREKDQRRLEVQITKKNVERIMREVYREIKKLSKGQKTTFKNLVAEWKREAVVAYFLPVLHLANKDKINLEQDQIFGEIFISPK